MQSAWKIATVGGLRRQVLGLVQDRTQMRKPTTTVLVIDDESQIRRVVSAGLDGYSVREAENGSAALRLAAHIHPDVIILDLGLPDMSGIEVLKNLRSWCKL